MSNHRGNQGQTDISLWHTVQYLYSRTVAVVLIHGQSRGILDSVVRVQLRGTSPMTKMSRTIICLLFAFFLNVIFGKATHAQSINAASCNSSDVQAALNKVAAAGTTVNIPAGNCTWTAAVTYNQVYSTTITGQTTVTCSGTAGTSGYSCSATDSTVIVDSYASSSPIFDINVATGTSLLRITGITFQGGNPGTGNVKYNGILQLNGASINTRVDHVHFDVTTYSSGGGSPVQYQGCLYGVVDHSVFDQGTGTTANAVRAYNSGTCNSDALGIGDQSWAQITGFGSSNFLFMEANQFNGGASNDCTKGGRYVSRYNYFNMTQPAPTVQTHPTGGGGRERGCRASEVYHNYFHAQSSNYINTADWLSSGTHLIWGNTTDSSSAGGGTGFRSLLSVHNMRDDSSTYGQGVPPAGWGYCGSSNWDGAQGSTGYPCLDQPGRGKGDLLIGGFTSDGSGSNNVTNSATGCIYSQTCAYPRQALEPIYEWMDAYSPVPSNPSGIYAQNGLDNTENTDIYLGTTDSGTAITFTGALTCSTAPRCGVGAGLLSARPSTCTPNGRLLGDGHEHALPMQDDEHLDGFYYIHGRTRIHTRLYRVRSQERARRPRRMCRLSLISWPEHGHSDE